LTPTLLAAVALAPGLFAGPVTLPGEVLVRSAGRPTSRDPVATDPVRAAFAAGTWAPPKDGADGWRSVPLKDGSAAAAGYTYVPVTADADRVMLLDAAGHSMVYVNGEPRIGDVYRTGYVRIPVHLKKGTNHFVFAPGRGPVSLRLSEPKAAAQLHLGDVTAPDLVVDEKIDTLAAVVVLNNTTDTTAGDLAIEAALPGGESVLTLVPPLPPLAVRKVGFRISGPAVAKDGPVVVSLKLVAKDALDTAELKLNAVKPGATRKRTFRSAIDGSVQYYAHVPALPEPDAGKNPGLVLTLHGASVEASGQAACYARKPGLHVVAPTNRRPYGFDWEDWGRLDAMEVLDLAEKQLGTDPRRVYLTGHSMGGHGTWHVGVTYPARFAAIAPSAGWVSLWSYAGMRKNANVPPEHELVMRAANPSDTLALVRNLGHTGVYVLHGDQDDNVPVGQARTIRKELADFHPDFAYFEQPGAGHWWGNACVDWPPLFDFLGRHTLPERAAVKAVDFRTANPGVSADCHWLTIEWQEKALRVSRVNLRHDPEKRTFTGETENVSLLSLDFGHLAKGKPVTVTLDGNTLYVPWPEKGERVGFVRNVRTEGKWVVTTPGAGTAMKGPHRSGPFRDAFRNRMVFVYGTQGTPEENAWALAKARFDAEQFWYRGNGSVAVMPDSLFNLKTGARDRNVILYGHADMNSAFKLFNIELPLEVEVRRGGVKVRDREVKGGNLACLFAEPRPGLTDSAMLGVVAGTGMHGLRLTDRLPYFASGAAYPDWVVMDPSGVRGAGYFGRDWSVFEGESAWRKE
jgi:poly(3-hydroxybutyrate) depolymerase